MKTRRYSEAQVFKILKEVESGMPVVNAAREHGVSPATIHRWKGKYFPFFITANEVAVSRELSASFRMYRVFAFGMHPVRVGLRYKLYLGRETV